MDNYISTHHRHPVSQGGANQPWNIIDVARKPHNAWHILVGNAPAPYIPHYLNRYCSQYTFWIIGNPEHATARAPIEGFSKRKGKIIGAWDTLFHNMSLQEVVYSINTTWIDPRFKLIAYPKTVHWKDAWQQFEKNHQGLYLFPSEIHTLDCVQLSY